jgi:transcription-repair coupling factor (superfamily II helicase)
VHGTAERMLLYRELDSIDNEQQLQKFSISLVDRFGKMPHECAELLHVIRLRWLAIGLGIEKIVLKSELMICYFPADQKSAYYQSETFRKILSYLQLHPKKCRMKEDGKLTLTYQNVVSVNQAVELLKEI